MAQTRLHVPVAAARADALFAALEAAFEEDGFPLALTDIDEERGIKEVSLYLDGPPEDTAARFAAVLSEQGVEEELQFETLPDIDFAAHAASLGAIARKVSSISELETALAAAKKNDRTTVLVIETDPLVSTEAGGHWWDVAVPEVSARKEVNAARKAYEERRRLQKVGD